MSLDLSRCDATGPNDPMTRLQGSTDIGGMYMHVDARFGWEDEDGVQHFHAYDEDLETLRDTLDPYAKFQTLTFEGREYIVLMYPHRH